MNTLKRQAKNWMAIPFCHLRLDEDRVTELLDVATEVFMEHGFEGASTNEIAKRANCSKTTLYARFPTKQDLFIAVLERRMDECFKEFVTALAVEGPIEAALMELGARILRVAAAKDKVRLERVVSMEAERFPELAERFYELGPQRGQELMSRYLQEQIKRGRLRHEDPDLMAEHLLSLITGGPIRWRVLRLHESCTPKENEQRLRAAISAFLRAYGPRK